MPSKPRCVLHVGTMKTGTSTIQSWLGENRKALEEAGWIYPGWPCRDSDRIAALVARSPEHQNLVISDEGLWHQSMDRSRTDEIAEALKGYDVTVLVYFRRPDEFLEAWFKQGLKVGSGVHAVQSFLKSYQTRPRALRKRLETFVTLFGRDNVIVAPYERSQLKNANLLSDFLARAGLPEAVATLPAPPDKNISPNAEAILLTGILRRSLDCEQAVIDQVMGALPREGLVTVKTSILTPQEAAAIRRRYRPLFRKIQKEFKTGVDPDFFRNWGDDEAPMPVSRLRRAYDELVTPANGQAPINPQRPRAPTSPSLVRRGIRRFFR